MRLSKMSRGVVAALCMAAAQGALALPVVKTDRAGFISATSGHKEETLAGFSLGLNSVDLKFGGGVADPKLATLQGLGTPDAATADGVPPGTSTSGRYSTTADSIFWEGAADDWEIVFENAVHAFGFDGTDIGDFAGDSAALRITLFASKASAAGSISFDVIGDKKDGTQIFWGFIDSAQSYERIVFHNLTADTVIVGTEGSLDGQGFDNFIIADAPRTDLPEPGALALVALAMVGLAVSRRRRGSRPC